MKHSSSGPVWLFTILGAVGAVIHLIHRRTCYDETGYVISGRPLTAVLVGLALAMALFAFIYAMVYAKRHVVLHSMTEAFSPRSSALFALPCIVAAMLVLVFAFYHILTAEYSSRPLEIAGIVSGILAVFSAAAMAALVLLIVRRIKGSAGAYLASLIGLFFCLWMVLHFINNRINPVILSFCMECVAFGCTAMFLFAFGSSAIGTTQTFSTVFFGLMSVGFSLLALTGQQIGREDLFLLLASVLFVAPLLVCYLHNVPKKDGDSARSGTKEE